MSINPWEVHCIKDFLFLNCPECSFKTTGKDLFQDHAVKNHPLSDAFYENDPFNRDDFQSQESIASQIESVEDIVCKYDETLGFVIIRGISILGEVRNVAISRATQQLLCSKSHDFQAVLALAHSKINQIA